MVKCPAVRRRLLILRPALSTLLLPEPVFLSVIFLAVIVAVLMVGISLPLSRTGLLSVRVTVHLTEGILIIAALVSSVLFFVHRTLPIHHMIRTL